MVPPSEGVTISDAPQKQKSTEKTTLGGGREENSSLQNFLRLRASSKHKLSLEILIVWLSIFLQMLGNSTEKPKKGGRKKRKKIDGTIVFVVLIALQGFLPTHLSNSMRSNISNLTTPKRRLQIYCSHLYLLKECKVLIL